jgi:hypothetical protein
MKFCAIPKWSSPQRTEPPLRDSLDELRAQWQRWAVVVDPLAAAVGIR